MVIIIMMFVTSIGSFLLGGVGNGEHFGEKVFNARLTSAFWRLLRFNGSFMFPPSRNFVGGTGLELIIPLPEKLKTKPNPLNPNQPTYNETAGTEKYLLDRFRQPRSLKNRFLTPSLTLVFPVLRFVRSLEASSTFVGPSILSDCK